jgi:cytochrome c biogenesis protein CcdA
MECDVLLTATHVRDASLRVRAVIAFVRGLRSFVSPYVLSVLPSPSRLSRGEML